MPKKAASSKSTAKKAPTPAKSAATKVATKKTTSKKATAASDAARSLGPSKPVAIGTDDHSYSHVVKRKP